MIEHLKGRERALASLGWTGREAEWIALVCLHSGVFTRDSVLSLLRGSPRARARRIREGHCLSGKEAVESDHVTVVNGGGRTCRISEQGDLPGAWESRTSATGGKANRFPFVMRRLLSLDFVLEHPGMNWLPTEGEKVEFIEGLGVHSNIIPRRIYYGAVRRSETLFRAQTSTSPVAIKTVTFAYVDPGHATAVRIATHGARHMDRFGMRSAPRGGGWR